MPPDPRTGRRADKATLVERGDQQQEPPADGGTLPPASRVTDFSSEATLPPPAHSAPQTANSSDTTLPPPPHAESTFASDTTLPPPPRTLVGNAGLTARPPTVATPQDATLDPDDPQAKAYQAAVSKGTTVPHMASFGDYQLIDTIAKGGMGIVYKARQRKLNRIVAIKMILTGQFADQTEVERFYAEAAAAGALNHPNIVGIHEVGEVNGQHFFSMDYVDGDSLSALVRESPLIPTRAAEHVKTIAETMQYAHDNGIVHRDLKPSNVLVDKKGRPLITDFGLAKSVSNQSQLTISGAIVGTPSYMPPEQAKGESEKVGPWSDIYSTGAILYELVTGHPPFRSATPFETVRQVIEKEPVSPRLVNPGVPKDLETICLKCLQKEPTKRYATSRELAEELGRFLRGEPIIARPIGRVERLWRWCRRNPLPATAIAASVLAFIIAGAGVTAGLVQTRRALAISEASFREQMSAVNDLLTSVSENTLLNQPGLQPLRKDLLRHALDYYERFARQRANDPAVQDELAAAHFRIGAITEALESLDQALPQYEIARQMQEKLLRARPHDPARLDALGTTLNAIGTLHVRQRRHSEALSAYASALKTRQQMVEAAPDDIEYQRLLGNTHMNIGLAHYNAREMEQARQQMLAAQQIHLAAERRDPNNVKLRRDVGKGHFNLGIVNWFDKRTDEAEKNFLSAVATFSELIRDQPNDLETNKIHAISLRILGDIHATQSPDLARDRYVEATDRLVTLVAKNPEVLDYQVELAGVWMNRAALEIELKKPATKELQQARTILESLAQNYPSIARFQRDLAKTLQALGYDLQAAGDLVRAREQFTKSSRLLADLVKRHPREIDYLAQYAGASIDLGQFELEQGDAKAAIKAFSTACETRRALVALLQDDPYQQLDLAVALHQLGTAQGKGAMASVGEATLISARALLSNLQKKLPKEPEVAQEIEAINAELAAPPFIVESPSH